MTIAQEWAVEIGPLAACEAMGVSRATFYREQKPKRPSAPRPPSKRALSEEERQAVLAVCHMEEFVDRPPATIHATLADRGVYLFRPGPCTASWTRRRRSPVPGFQRKAGAPWLPSGSPPPRAALTRVPGAGAAKDDTERANLPAGKWSLARAKTHLNLKDSFYSYLHLNGGLVRLQGPRVQRVAYFWRAEGPDFGERRSANRLMVSDRYS